MKKFVLLLLPILLALNIFSAAAYDQATPIVDSSVVQVDGGGGHTPLPICHSGNGRHWTYIAPDAHGYNGHKNHDADIYGLTEEECLAKNESPAAVTSAWAFCDGSNIKVKATITNPDSNGPQVTIFFNGETKTHNQAHNVEAAFNHQTYKGTWYSGYVQLGTSSQAFSVEGCQTASPPASPTATTEPEASPSVIPEEPTVPPATPTDATPVPPTEEPIVTTLTGLTIMCVGAFDGSLVMSLDIENPSPDVSFTVTTNGVEELFYVNGNPTVFIVANDTYIGTEYGGTVTLGETTLSWSHDGCGEVTTPPATPDGEETPVNETPVDETPDVETPVDASPTVPVITTPVVIIGTPIDATQTPDSETVTTPDEVTIVSGLPSTGQAGADTDENLQISGGDILFILIVILLILLIVYVWQFIRR